MPSDAARAERSAPAPAIGAAEAKRARGRPRRETIERAVLEATTDLLREVGARGTTINAIAERSRTSKSAIYRRWTTRDAILVDALRLAAQGRPDDILRVVELERELGSTVHAAAQRGAEVFASPVLLAVLPTITREVLAGSPIGEAFRRDIFTPVRRDAKERLLHAIDRGELSPDVDRDLLFDLIYGAMLYRALVGAPVDDAVAHALADLVMGGAAGAAYRSTAARSASSGGNRSPHARSRAAR